MDCDEDACEVQNCRNYGRLNNSDVRHAKAFGHKEGGGAHDRRHKLASGGGGSLYRTGELALVAQPFHHRNGEGAGAYGV